MTSEPSPSERRVRAVPWEALRGVAASLDAPIAEVLAGATAERVLDRALRAHRALDAAGRAAVAEAIFGVGLWRRRLLAALGEAGAPPCGGDPGGVSRAGAATCAPAAGSPPAFPPRLLLAALLRDLGGREDAAALVGLSEGALPPAAPPPQSLADRYSLPDWLAAELVRATGEDAGALADALCLPGPICLRANLLRTTGSALAARLAAAGVATRPGRLAPACLVVEGPRPNVYGLAAYREGLLEVQDEGSQLLGAAVGARAGEAVLDACAGAGGKTLLLAAAVGPTGRVHAADPDLSRLARLRVRAAAAGAGEIVVVHGAEAPPPLVVDRVLVDAPCSELGTLRRGPDLRWRLDPFSFAALPALQLDVLSRAASHVRPGGRLVYATCTFRREEDEEVAVAFEAAHPGFARMTPELDPSVLTAEGFVRTWPHRHGTDAFFAAAWTRG